MKKVKEIWEKIKLILDFVSLICAIILFIASFVYAFQDKYDAAAFCFLVFFFTMWSFGEKYSSDDNLEKRLDEQNMDLLEE